MNKRKAIAAMLEGKKVTHKHFIAEEWVSLKHGRYVFEDGCRCDPNEFWMYRTCPSWNDDWRIFNE